MTAPAPGAAGVPIEAIKAKTAINEILPNVTSYPALDAMKIAAITCIIAVPFMLIVIPSGKMNEATSSLTPSSSVVVFVFKGNVAAEEEVENPNIATLPIFLTNGIGFKRVAMKTNNAYPKIKKNNNVKTTVTT